MSNITENQISKTEQTTEPYEVRVRKLVNKGVRLCRMIAKIEPELDAIKTSLRGFAKDEREKGDAKKPIVFIGTTGSATVTFKADSLKVNKEKKIEELKKALPANVFYNLFDEETVITPVSDFKKKLEKLSSEDKAKIIEYLNSVPNTPAVEFSK